MNLALRLSGEAVDGQPVCGLGLQLARIVTLLSNPLGEVVWYAADVDPVYVADVEPVGNASLTSKETPSRVGPSYRLVELVQNVDQFLRGVFLAVDVEISNPQFRKHLDTEDSIDVDLGDAIVEIRAFDTTYFEILTREKQIADFVAETFGVHPISEG